MRPLVQMSRSSSTRQRQKTELLSLPTPTSATVGRSQRAEALGHTVSRSRSRKPDAVARAILSNLSQLTDALARGSIVTFEPSRVRVRALPINTMPVDANGL